MYCTFYSSPSLSLDITRVIEWTIVTFNSVDTRSTAQTWGQVHEYLYLSTLKYKFESTCTLLKYFLNYRNVLVLILKYFCQVLEYLKYF